MLRVIIITPRPTQTKCLELYIHADIRWCHMCIYIYTAVTFAYTTLNAYNRIKYAHISVYIYTLYANTHEKTNK